MQIRPKTVTWHPPGGEEDVVLHVRPMDLLAGIDFGAAVNKPGAGTREQLEAMIEACVQHTDAWEGVYAGDEPAECNTENKRAFFAAASRHAAMMLAFEAVAGEMPGVDDAKKKLSGSMPGSASRTRRSNAAKGTTRRQGGGGDAAGLPQ